MNKAEFDELKRKYDAAQKVLAEIQRYETGIEQIDQLQIMFNFNNTYKCRFAFPDIPTELVKKWHGELRKYFEAKLAAAKETYACL